MISLKSDTHRSALPGGLILVLLFLVAVVPGHGEDPKPSKDFTPRFDPVAQDIEGWTVWVEPMLLPGGEQEEEGGRALKMLANHLQRVAILVPEPALAKLRTCEIWLEYKHPELGNMQYHPDEEWLMENGYDKRLAKKVHITHTGELLSRQEMLKHPAVILHELAHAYHDQVLSFDHAGILGAYEAAMEKGNYEEVLLYDGRTVEHYATTNQMEYFAEATEAYFYRNDFFPFVAAELQIHDPRIFQVLQEVWGKP